MTKRRRHTPERIIRKLAEGNTLLAGRTDLDEVCRHPQIAEATWHPRQAPIATAMEHLNALPDSDVAAVAVKARPWTELVGSPDYQAAVHAADTWCAEFVADKTLTAPAVTHEQFETADVDSVVVDGSGRFGL